MSRLNLLKCCLWANVLLVFVVECLSDDPKVCTIGVGCYIGTTMEFQSKTFEAFLGIPYAFPPGRFKPAILYRSDENHDAKTPQHDCIQKNYLLPNKPISGSEDCLYLNVYKPLVRRNLKYITKHSPVMVYIFGEGFFAGTANPIITGPEYIMQHDNIILVTLGYRLGPFGFLTTNDEYLPGNLGLKDQHLALEWVLNYISYFGGDRQRITLFGQSAGAVSAHLHMLSNLRQNIYAIIALSGTANVPFAIDAQPEQIARLTARHCNITDWNTCTTEKLKNSLLKVSAKNLLNAGDHLKYWGINNMAMYRPIVEKPGKYAFLTEHPVTILQSGNYTPVPIMFGRVPNEGGVQVVAIMESEKLLNKFNDNFYEFLEQILEFPLTFNKSQVERKTNQIIKEYFNGTEELNKATEQGFMDMVTHRVFYYPLYNVIKLHVENIDTDKYPIFMYNFDYIGRYTFADLYAGHPTDSKYGVVHSNDLIYLFRSSIIFPDFEPNSREALVVKNFVDDFVYFARNRKPKMHANMKSCNKDNYYPAVGEICDYEEYINSKDEELAIIINNEFDTIHMDFWDNIFQCTCI